MERPEAPAAEQLRTKAPIGLALTRRLQRTLTVISAIMVCERNHGADVLPLWIADRLHLGI